MRLQEFTLWLHPPTLWECLIYSKHFSICCQLCIVLILTSLTSPFPRDLNPCHRRDCIRGGGVYEISIRIWISASWEHRLDCRWLHQSKTGVALGHSSTVALVPLGLKPRCSFLQRGHLADKGYRRHRNQRPHLLLVHHTHPPTSIWWQNPFIHSLYFIRKTSYSGRARESVIFGKNIVFRYVAIILWKIQTTSYMLIFAQW